MGLCRIEGMKSYTFFLALILIAIACEKKAGAPKPPMETLDCVWYDGNYSQIVNTYFCPKGITASGRDRLTGKPIDMTCNGNKGKCCATGDYPMRICICKENAYGVLEWECGHYAGNVDQTKIGIPVTR